MSETTATNGNGLRFERSDQVDELFAALVKAQSQIKGALRDRINPHFKSRYADLASTWDACRDALTTNGLAVLQPVHSDGQTLTVVTLLGHTSGQWISSQMTGMLNNGGAQEMGSLTSYFRRYGLASMVGVAPEDDDDGEAAEEGRTAPSAPRTATGPACPKCGAYGTLLKPRTEGDPWYCYPPPKGKGCGARIKNLDPTKPAQEPAVVAAPPSPAPAPASEPQREPGEDPPEPTDYELAMDRLDRVKSQEHFNDARAFLKVAKPGFTPTEYTTLQAKYADVKKAGGWR